MTHHNDQPADTEMVDFMVHSYETILRNAARGTGRDVEPLLRFLRNSDFYESRCSSHHHFAGGTAQHCMEVYLHAHMPHPPRATCTGSATGWSMTTGARCLS